MAQGNAKLTKIQKAAKQCNMSEAEYTRVHGQAEAARTRGKRSEPAAVAKLRSWGDCEGQTGLFAEPAPERTRKATGLETYTDDNGDYHVLGRCTRTEALAAMRAYALTQGDEGPPANCEADLTTDWVVPSTTDPEVDAYCISVPPNTPGAEHITTWTC